MHRTSREEHICGTYAGTRANTLFCVKKLSAISDFLWAWSAQLLVQFLMRPRLWLWFHNVATLLSSQSSGCSPEPDQPPVSASEGYEVGRGWSRAKLWWEQHSRKHTPLFRRVSVHTVCWWRAHSLWVTIFINLIEFGILGRLSLGVSVRTFLEGLPEDCLECGWCNPLG